MKRIASLFLILCPIFTWNLHANEAVQLKEHIAAMQGPDIVDNDGYLLLDCCHSSIERKSKSTEMKGFHLYYGEHQGTVHSLNWSGYSAFTGTKKNPNPTFGSVTEASGTWTVPELASSRGGDTYSSAWVGIDGYVSPVVEQIGTEHDVINGIPTYFAWFEMFPADSQLIEGFPVDIGDKIEAQVTYEGIDGNANNLFRLALKNHTKKVKFAIVQSTLPGNPAHLSSANWIVEAPAISVPTNCIGILPLADFGTIFFENCQATIEGRKGAINDKHWTYTAISMVTTGGRIKDTASHLSTHCHKSSDDNKKSKCKNSFSILWKKTGPFPYDTFCDQ